MTTLVHVHEGYVNIILLQLLQSLIFHPSLLVAVFLCTRLLDICCHRVDIDVVSRLSLRIRTLFSRRRLMPTIDVGVVCAKGYVVNCIFFCGVVIYIQIIASCKNMSAVASVVALSLKEGAWSSRHLARSM